MTHILGPPVGGHRGWGDGIHSTDRVRRPGRINGPAFGDVADNEDHYDSDAVHKKNAIEDHEEGGVQISPHVFNNDDRDCANNEDAQ